jgi:hypothetical protein
VNDPTNGVSTTYDQLIGDIVATRKAIFDAWPREHFDNYGILKGSPWIGLLVPTSYEFVVGCLVILSVGGAIMPMRKLLHECVMFYLTHVSGLAKGISSDEADHFFEQCDSRLLIVGSGQREVALKI